MGREPLSRETVRMRPLCGLYFRHVIRPLYAVIVWDYDRVSKRINEIAHTWSFIVFQCWNISWCKKERERENTCVCVSLQNSLSFFDLDLNYKSVEYFGVILLFRKKIIYLLYLNVKHFLKIVLNILKFFGKEERKS